MKVLDKQTRLPVPTDSNGVFLVRDQHDYCVEGEAPLAGIEPVLVVLPVGGGLFGELFFENYVGLAEVAGHRFRVMHSKLTEDAFTAMLDGVVKDVGDLAFDFCSRTSLPFEREGHDISRDEV